MTDSILTAIALCRSIFNCYHLNKLLVVTDRSWSLHFALMVIDNRDLESTIEVP